MHFSTLNMFLNCSLEVQPKIILPLLQAQQAGFLILNIPFLPGKSLYKIIRVTLPFSLLLHTKNSCPVSLARLVSYLFLAGEGCVPSPLPCHKLEHVSTIQCNQFACTSRKHQTYCAQASFTCTVCAVSCTEYPVLPGHFSFRFF